MSLTCLQCNIWFYFVFTLCRFLSNWVSMLLLFCYFQHLHQRISSYLSGSCICCVSMGQNVHQKVVECTYILTGNKTFLPCEWDKVWIFNMLLSRKPPDSPFHLPVFVSYLSDYSRHGELLCWGCLPVDWCQRTR